MNPTTFYKIRNKYNNIIFPNLPNLIINYINKNPNELPKILSVNINKLLYYLKNKEFHNEQQLLNQTLEYIKNELSK